MLNCLFVVVVSCADEVVVGCVHLIPNALDLACYIVNVFLGGDACLEGLIFDLLAVLVSACEEENVIAALSLIAGDAVCHNYLVGITEVRLL